MGESVGWPARAQAAASTDNWCPNVAPNVHEAPGWVHGRARGGLKRSSGATVPARHTRQVTTTRSGMRLVFVSCTSGRPAAVETPRGRHATRPTSGSCERYACVEPRWRNGRRGRLKIDCPQGRQGSNPCLGTMSATTPEPTDCQAPNRPSGPGHGRADPVTAAPRSPVPPRVPRSVPRRTGRRGAHRAGTS